MHPPHNDRLLAIAGTLAFSLGSFFPVDGLAQPRIVLEPEYVAFGDIPENETRLVQVSVRNAGDGALRIHDVQVNCYCVEPTLEVRELGPGESTTMDVLFNSRGFQGHQMKYIAISSNDPLRGRIDYGVTAHVTVPLLMDPHQALIRFPTLRTGQTHTETYTFQSGEVPRLEIEPGSWPRQWLDIDIERDSDPQLVQIHFTARPEGAVGRYRDTVRLNTNVPAAPDVSIEVDVTLAADLILSLERVNLGAVLPGTALHNRLSVTAFQPGIAFNLTGAEIDIPGMQARVINDKEGRFAIIGGKALAGDHPSVTANRGRIQGTLRIFSDLESTPEMQVPVTYILRR
jgi:hypothetical protein